MDKTALVWLFIGIAAGSTIFHTEITEAIYSIPPTWAFANFTIGGTSIEADTFNDELTIIAGSGIVLTPDAVTDSLTIQSTVGALGDSVYGGMFLSSPNGTISVDDVTPVIINLWTDEMESNLTTPKHLKGNITMNTDALIYVSYFASFGGSTNSNVHQHLFVNDVSTTECKTHRELGGGDTGSNSFGCILDVSQGDELDVRAYRVTGSGDFTPSHMQFSLHNLGGAINNSTTINTIQNITGANIPAAYLIEANATHINAINGTTGSNDFASTDFVTVLENSFTGLKPTRDFKQKVIVKGNFTASSTINIPSFTHLEIQGKITAANGLDLSLIENDDQTYSGGNEHIELSGGIIDGNKAGQSTPTDTKNTIDFSFVNNLHIHDTTVLNGWTTALRTEHVNYGIIENNRIDYSADDCIAINENTNYTSVVGNVVSRCGYGIKYGAPNGIEIQDMAHDVTVVGNVVRGALDNGIEGSTHSGKLSPFNVMFSSNTIQNVTNGINLDGEPGSLISDVTIDGNNIYNVTNKGVFVKYGKGLLIQNNFINVTENGINIFTDSLKNVLRDNFISHSEQGGIQIEAVASDNLILDNIVRDSGTQGSGTRVGINILGDDNVIKGNIIEETGAGDTRNGIALQSGSSGNELIDNHFIDIVTRNINDLTAGQDFTTTLTKDYWDIGETRSVVKTADESVTSSTTTQDDDELTLSIGGDGAVAGRYFIQVHYRYTASTTGDIKATVSMPGGTTGQICEDADGSGQPCQSFGTTLQQAGQTTTRNMRLNGYADTDGTSGSILFRWAQNTVHATPTIIEEGSVLEVTRVS